MNQGMDGNSVALNPKYGLVIQACIYFLLFNSLVGSSEFIDVVPEHKKLKTHIVDRNDARILCSVYNEKNYSS